MRITQEKTYRVSTEVLSENQIRSRLKWAQENYLNRMREGSGRQPSLPYVSIQHIPMRLDDET